MSEERDDLVVLVDEDGGEVEFEHLDTIEFNGSEYVVLLPLVEEEVEVEEEEEEEEEDMEEVVILKIEHGADGEDSFVSVENDEELDAVFEQFKVRMEEEYEFEEN